jgi:hypothetical protein
MILKLGTSGDAELFPSGSCITTHRQTRMRWPARLSYCGGGNWASPGLWCVGGQRRHRLELLRCGAEGGPDCGDFTEPALLPGPLEPVQEIGVDPLQSRQLVRTNLEWCASDAGVSCAHGFHGRGRMFQERLPQLAVCEERVPFPAGEVAVFLAGPLSAARAMNAWWCAITSSGQTPHIPMSCPQWNYPRPWLRVPRQPERMASVTKRRRNRSGIDGLPVCSNTS